MILLANLLRRRAVSVQEHDVPAEAVGDWASEVSTTVPLCRKHETKFDTSEMKQQLIDRFGGRNNPAQKTISGTVAFHRSRSRRITWTSL